MKKQHIFWEHEMAASITSGVNTTALCGYQMVHTKKSWERGRGRPICDRCMNIWSARQDGTSIRGRFPNDRPPTPRPVNYTITWTNSTWTR